MTLETEAYRGELAGLRETVRDNMRQRRLSLVETLVRSGIYDTELATKLAMFVEKGAIASPEKLKGASKSFKVRDNAPSNTLPAKKKKKRKYTKRSAFWKK